MDLNFQPSVLAWRRTEKEKTMKKAAKTSLEQEMLPEYDFRHGVRGKYADRYAAGTNLVLLAPDVAAAFPNSEAVNEALRALIENHTV